MTPTARHQQWCPALVAIPMVKEFPTMWTTLYEDGEARSFHLPSTCCKRTKTVNVGWRGVNGSPPIVWEVRFNKRKDEFRDRYPDISSIVFLTKIRAEKFARKIRLSYRVPVDVIEHTSGTFTVVCD